MNILRQKKIENIYVRSKYVAQSFIYGDSMKASLVGVIVPEETVLFEYAKEHNLEQNMTTLSKNSDIKALILKDINEQGKLGGLKGFEQAKNIHLHDELFTCESGLLTPTMKAKRPDLTKYFKSQLDEMYKSLD